MQKQLTGTVISDKMEKTLTVGVESVWQHPRYKKRIRKVKKYFVHDENSKAKEGDKVLIQESKPVSKNKRWVLVEVISK